MEATEVDKAGVRILARIEPVENISCFGEALMHSGAVKTQEGKRYTRQGYALFAGRALRRLERLGLAVDGVSGWRAVRHNT